MRTAADDDLSLTCDSCIFSFSALSFSVPCEFMGWSPFKVSHDPAKFSGHNDFGRGDIMILVCHVIFQDHVIKVSCDFINKKQSRYVTILSGFVHSGSGDTSLVCHIVQKTT